MQKSAWGEARPHGGFRRHAPAPRLRLTFLASSLKIILTEHRLLSPLLALCGVSLHTHHPSDFCGLRPSRTAAARTLVTVVAEGSLPLSALASRKKKKGEKKRRAQVAGAFPVASTTIMGSSPEHRQSDRRPSGTRWGILRWHHADCSSVQRRNRKPRRCP